MSEICRKDMLARNLNRMAKCFPEHYNFFPKTWVLPAEYDTYNNADLRGGGGGGGDDDDDDDDVDGDSDGGIVDC